MTLGGEMDDRLDGFLGEEPGQFARPQGMTIEPRPEGEALLVADCSNHRVQRFSLDGELLGIVDVRDVLWALLEA